MDLTVPVDHRVKNERKKKIVKSTHIFVLFCRAKKAVSHERDNDIKSLCSWYDPQMPGK